MRDQYKVLAEKYGELNHHVHNQAGNNMEFVRDIFKFIEGATIDEAIELLHYVDTVFRKQHGFHPDGETVTEIYLHFVGVYGEENGLKYNGSWINPEGREKARKHVMQVMYNGSVEETEKKRQAILNKDNPGIEMDI